MSKVITFRRIGLLDPAGARYAHEAQCAGIVDRGFPAAFVGVEASASLAASVFAQAFEPRHCYSCADRIPRSKPRCS